MPEKKQNRDVVKRKEQPTKTGNGKGKNYLLTIGINKYKNYNPLFNAVEDAEAIARVLTERYGFEDTFTLYDEEATRDNILGQLEELEELITPKDNLLIFYAGHGYYHKKTGYLVPQNAPSKTRRGLIANSTFIENLKTIDAHHILLIFDSCFSGSLIVSRDIQIHSVAERVGRIRSRYAISAGNIELVSDGVVGNHSPFTKAIVDFLQQNKVAQLPVSHLFTEIRKITTYNAEQTPLGGPIPRMDNAGGEFIFELENTEPILIIINPKEETAWQLAENQKSISGYLKYLIAFPQGKHITKAYEQMEILEKQFSLPKSVSKEETPTEASKVLLKAERKKRLDALKSLSGPHWKRVLPSSGTFTDTRDGQTYKTLKLKDGKTWMVQNFKFDVGEGCWHYDNDPKRGKEFGRLYSWEAAKKACPAGWRLPDMEEDWEVMIDLYGGFFNYHDPKSDLYNNGEKAFHNLMTNEDVGFMAKLGGLRNCKGDFRDLALTSAYWSNTLRGEHILSCNFDKDNQAVEQVEAMDCLAYSCRYVKIEEEKLAKPPLFNKEKLIKPIPHIIKDPNSFTDPRDGQVYKTVKLKDGKRWMAQNLNFDIGEGCWFYDNDVKNGEKFGRLYTWEAALKACPEGWHLPSDEEWKNLISFYGGTEKAYKYLIDGGSSGFFALLGGYCGFDGDFINLGYDGYNWSCTEGASSHAYSYNFYIGDEDLGSYYNNKSLGFSCRCLQD